jgi:hypothetical protein
MDTSSDRRGGLHGTRLRQGRAYRTGLESRYRCERTPLHRPVIGACLQAPIPAAAQAALFGSSRTPEKKTPREASLPGRSVVHGRSGDRPPATIRSGRYGHGGIRLSGEQAIHGHAAACGPQRLAVMRNRLSHGSLGIGKTASADANRADYTPVPRYSARQRSACCTVTAGAKKNRAVPRRPGLLQQPRYFLSPLASRSVQTSGTRP